jgi:hypothetical protein
MEPCEFLKGTGEKREGEKALREGFLSLTLMLFA